MANFSGSNTAPAGSGANSTNQVALVVVTSLFFIWGLTTVLNDLLVAQFKRAFDLTHTEAQLIQFAFFAAYFLFSLPSAKIVDALGYKRTMVLGLVTVGVGALLFVPAASLPSYPLFLGALMVVATGITALQVSANPYVAVLGPAETASSRLNLTQAFNSLGTFIGPYLGGIFILSAAPLALEVVRQMPPETRHAYSIEQASTVKGPYVVLALVVFLLAAVISRFKLPPIPTAEKHGEVADSVWKHRNLLYGVIAIFAYVGAEVSIGSFLILYFALPEIGNMADQQAKLYVSLYWGGAMVGRFIGAWLLRRFKTGRLLGMAALTASLLVCVSMLTFHTPAMVSIILVGLFNSIMFPSIFTLGIAELGPLTGDGSGFLNMAIVGGAILPLTQGFIADQFGLHHAFILPILCYLYIAWYAFKGSEPRVAS